MFVYIEAWEHHVCVLSTKLPHAHGDVWITLIFRVHVSLRILSPRKSVALKKRFCILCDLISVRLNMKYSLAFSSSYAHWTSNFTIDFPFVSQQSHCVRFSNLLRLIFLPLHLLLPHIFSHIRLSYMFPHIYTFQHIYVIYLHVHHIYKYFVV